MARICNRYSHWHGHQFPVEHVATVGRGSHAIDHSANQCDAQHHIYRDGGYPENDHQIAFSLEK